MHLMLNPTDYHFNSHLVFNVYKWRRVTCTRLILLKKWQMQVNQMKMQKNNTTSFIFEALR